MGTKDAIGKDISLPINSVTLDHKILRVARDGCWDERQQDSIVRPCIISI